MGEAKRRRAEIERLKAMSPAQGTIWQADEAKLRRGINPEESLGDPSGIIAMARRLNDQIAQAKASRSIYEVVQYLYKKVDATIYDLRDIPIACGKGCSHCCTIWVSVSAPEAIYVGNIVNSMGGEAIEKVRAANEVTRQFDYELRDRHPHDCAMLENKVCTIYEHRPKECRQAASADANICARKFRILTDEQIPSPINFMRSRSAYALALNAALSKAGLQNGAYEFNSAVTRVLDTPNAEVRWLAGEHIFDGVLSEPMLPQAFLEQISYIKQKAFGE
jgi:Fe-S-cluster containining protein